MDWVFSPYMIAGFNIISSIKGGFLGHHTCTYINRIMSSGSQHNCWFDNSKFDQYAQSFDQYDHSLVVFMRMLDSVAAGKNWNRIKTGLSLMLVCLNQYSNYFVKFVTFCKKFVPFAEEGCVDGPTPLPGQPDTGTDHCASSPCQSFMNCVQDRDGYSCVCADNSLTCGGGKFE